MKKIPSLAVTLFLSSTLLTILFSQYDKTKRVQPKPGTSVSNQSINPVGHTDEPATLDQMVILSLREGDKNELVTLTSYTIGSFQGGTDIYIRSSKIPQFSLVGFFRQAYQTDIENDGNDELVVEVETGHSIDTSFYKYSNGNLNKILISDGSPTINGSVTKRNIPEFKDVEGDGSLEMFVYYRFFPPEKRRTVEVYKFNGQKFLKVNEYEESTADFYL